MSWPKRFTEEQTNKADAERLRDTFAAAALTGLLVHANDDIDEETLDTPSDIAYTAYQMADAMLRERGNRQGNLDSSNHDAAPAARASLPTADHAVRRGCESGCGTGKQTAPPCVETDGFSPGSSSDPIHRNAERESPRGECGESPLRDVTHPDKKGQAAGGPEHHISEAEIDALEFVVEEGRIANIHDYGILRSMLIRLRQEWEFRPESYAQSDERRGDSPTSRDTTQPRNGALGKPVAWAVVYPDDEVAVIAFKRRDADERATASDRIVPLYRQPQPTLTDAEQEAVEWCRDNITLMAHPASAFAFVHTHTLRGLLERLGGEK